MSRARRIETALAALFLAACASSPPALVALPPAPQNELARIVERPAATVLLRTVRLPGYLDSYGVVVDRDGNTLVVAHEAEWAERLQDAATRVLRDALSRRLGDSRVLLQRDHRRPDAYLAVDFLRLDPSGSALELDATWSFACVPGRRSANAGRTTLREPLPARTPNGVATATANALGRLADALATHASCGADAASATPDGLQPDRARAP